jgi:hypothetical protein
MSQHPLRPRYVSRILSGYSFAERGMRRTIEIFMTNRGQIVRCTKEFPFDLKQVFTCKAGDKVILPPVDRTGRRT